MTSTDDHDPPDRQPPVDPRQRRESWREEIEAAEPPPLTDAMLTPQAPSAAGPDGPPAGDDCHVCGERNQVGAAHCLNCGVQLTSEPPGPDGAEEAGRRIASQQDDGSELNVSVPDPGDGFLNPDEEMPLIQRRRPSERLGEQLPGPGEQRDAQRTLQVALAALTVVVIVTLLVITFGDGEGDGGGSAPSSTTVAVDVAALDVYGNLIAGLAVEIDALSNDAALTNERWDQETADFATTLADLARIADLARPIAVTVDAADVPVDADAALHVRLARSANVVAESAEAMVAGLEAPDEGQARAAALNRFTAATDEFGAIAVSIARVLSEGAEPG